MTTREIHQLQGKRVVHGQEVRAMQVPFVQKPAEEHRAVLEKIRNGLATRVRILASHDSCPVCRTVEGAYEFDEVPELPLEGCSHPMGCRCYYAPVLDRYGP